MSRLIVTRAVCAALCGLTLALAACSGSSSGGSSGGGAGPTTAGGGSSASSGGAGGGGTTTHGTSQAAQHHATVDTCKLITKAEAAKALGESVAAGNHDSDDPTACDWVSTTGDHFSDVAIALWPSFDDEYDNRNDPAQATLKAITVVPGLGDKAYTEYFKGATASKAGSSAGLAAKKGDVALFFQVLSPSLTRAQSFAADKVLARAALGRL